jgi:HD-like signal output (HDOD) protein
LLAQLPVDDDPRADPMPDHARAGAYLLGLWGMDYPIIDAVARHHEPLPRIPAALDAATAVRVAAAIVGGRRDHPDPRWAPWCRASEDDREEAA